LIIFLVVLVISMIWTNSCGAPWVPTPMSMVHKMLQMAEVGPGDLVYDLGCGDGRILVTAPRRYGARAVGIELDPLRYLWCQLLITALGLRDRAQVVFGDFFKQDLSAADVVTCYLLRGTNKELQGKFKGELGSKTRVVSNSLPFRNCNWWEKIRKRNSICTF
jgi:16S rRNA A1518/A1519 N6-dimethyltransferase RsmA/KsgA/DIM1 with predicted DNA glycosylase/AP lyase activity